MHTEKPTRTTGQNSNFVSKINPKPDPNDCQISYLKYESDLKKYEQIEALAAIDHDQWQFWSQGILRDLDGLVTALHDVDNRMIEANIGYANSPAHQRVINLIRKHNERDERWEKQRCAYKQLPEETKEHDRLWAKREWEALKEK